MNVDVESNHKREHNRIRLDGTFHLFDIFESENGAVCHIAFEPEIEKYTQKVKS